MRVLLQPGMGGAQQKASLLASVKKARSSVFLAYHFGRLIGEESIVVGAVFVDLALQSRVQKTLLEFQIVQCQET
jgi:hypothetical protein